MRFRHLALLGVVLVLPGFLWSATRISTGTAHYIEFDSQKDIAIMRGDAKIDTSSATITADQIIMYRKSNIGHAQGNVVIVESTRTMRGQEAFYNWKLSTGTIVGASGMDPPWRFQGDEMEQTAPRVIRVRKSWLSSCDHNPPHYLLRSRKGRILSGHRINLLNPRLVVDDTAVFWSPFYTRSLLPKKYTLRIVPGHTSRDGFTAKTTVGYPFSPNTQTKFRWDYFERTGNGGGIAHRYWLKNIRGNVDVFLVRDHNSDDRPQERRYTALWNHYQQITTKLTLNAKLDFKSDQKFGDEFSGEGNGTLVENQSRGLVSEAGLTYQLPRSSLRADFKRKDKFDSSVSGKSFISQIILPVISYNTIPLKWKYFPVYTTFSADYRNETAVRNDPTEELKYQRKGNSKLSLKRDLRFLKTTFTPELGYKQSWREKDFTKPDSSKDIFQGRYETRLDVRRRFFRLIDLTVGYTYIGRAEENRLNLDTEADDRGIETNSMNGSFVTRLGRRSRFSMSSGYDLKDPPKSNPDLYEHSSQRWSSLVFDLQWGLSKTINIFFRETYSIFDARTVTPINTPQNTSGEIQFGDAMKKSYFSQGFSYTKKAHGAESLLNLNNKLTFFLTPKWYINLNIAYQAVGPKKLNYRKVSSTSKSISVVRDLHCWLLRMEFAERGDRTEASFFIDLKVSVNDSEVVFGRKPGDSFFPTRGGGADISEIFKTKEIDENEDIENSEDEESREAVPE